MIGLVAGLIFWIAVAVFGFVDVVRPVALATLIVGLLLRVTSTKMYEEAMKEYKLYIFDADGTLTPQRDGSCGVFAYEPLPGVAEKCTTLYLAGAMLAIASNQSAKRPVIDIRYQMTWTSWRLYIPMTFVLWAHTDEWRKPKPTMLLELIKTANVTPSDVLFVGDQETDKQAAEAAGVDFAWAKDFFGR